MVLVNTKDMLAKARKHCYAVGHFNTTDIEETQAIVQAANELNAPVILGASTKAITYAGLKNLHDIIANIAREVKIPIALHLDHGPSSDWALRCIDNGWTSVMIDTSKLDYKNNIKETIRVVNYAHNRNVSVEAEIGVLKGIEDDLVVKDKEAVFTDPKQAKEFMKATGCDSLAIAIGTSHGAFKFHGTPKLDLARLKLIREIVNVPLVLHGASSVYQDVVKSINRLGGKVRGAQGVPDSILRSAVKLGICKINTDTDLRLAFTLGVRSHLKKDPANYDIRETLEAAKEELVKMTKRKIKVFGSEGMA